MECLKIMTAIIYSARLKHVLEDPQRNRNLLNPVTSPQKKQDLISLYKASVEDAKRIISLIDSTDYASPRDKGFWKKSDWSI